MVKKNFSHVYTFFSGLKELQVNKVPIFTRLKSCQKMMRKLKEENIGQIGYGTEHEQEYQMQTQIRAMYKKVFEKMNSYSIGIK
jgi:hypothetical protein